MPLLGFEDLQQWPGTKNLPAPYMNATWIGFQVGDKDREPVTCNRSEIGQALAIGRYAISIALAKEGVAEASVATIDPTTYNLALHGLYMWGLGVSGLL